MFQSFRLFPLVSAALLLVSCTTVPETGRRQLMLVSSGEEARMGFSAFEQIKKEEKISTDKAANERVSRVGGRIAGAVGRDIPNAQWEFVVFDSETVNAFALPGGKVGVYTGLLKLAATDDELAVVMGHEIAHVTSRHGAERVSQNYAVAGIGIATAVALEVSDADSKTKNLTLAAYGLGATVGVMLPYSRLHESEADAVGLKYAAAAGYDPRAAATFWRKMSAASKSKVPEILSTHPSDETRIHKLEEIAPNYMDLYEKNRLRYEGDK